MKKITLLLICFIALTAGAEKFITKTGKISFYSDAPLEKIEAHNRAVGVLLDSETGSLRFSVLIKSFVFEKKLMQEHFNENYLESGKYPKASFTGKVTDMPNLTKDGTHKVMVNGKLTIHGVTKSVSESGTLTVKNGNPSLNASFKVLLDDYKIKIPGAVKDKIAKDVKIVVDADLNKI